MFGKELIRFKYFWGEISHEIYKLLCFLPLQMLLMYLNFQILKILYFMVCWKFTDICSLGSEKLFKILFYYATFTDDSFWQEQNLICLKLRVESGFQSRWEYLTICSGIWQNAWFYYPPATNRPWNSYTTYLGLRNWRLSIVILDFMNGKLRDGYSYELQWYFFSVRNKFCENFKKLWWFFPPSKNTADKMRGLKVSLSICIHYVTNLATILIF